MAVKIFFIARVLLFGKRAFDFGSDNPGAA